MNHIIKSPIISLDVYDIHSPKGKSVKLNGRPFCSLTYRKQGLVKIKTDEESFSSMAEDITFIPKGQEYSTKIVQDTHMIAIHFDHLGENLFKKPFVLQNNNQQLKQLFDLVLEAYSIDDGNNYECYSYVYRLLFEIEKRFLEKKESKIIPAVREAKLMIEKQFSDNNFNIDLLISHLSVSASYLRREFKKAYAVTPIEYLKYVRHQKAVSMLTSDYYTVDTIARECGYASTSYFIQSFHKMTGYSPMKYKKKFSS